MNQGAYIWSAWFSFPKVLHNGLLCLVIIYQPTNPWNTIQIRHRFWNLGWSCYHSNRMIAAILQSFVLFFAQNALHAEALARESFSTKNLLPLKLLSKEKHITGKCAERSFCPQKLDPFKYFHSQVHSHRYSFTHERSCSQKTCTVDFKQCMHVYLNIFLVLERKY